MVSNFNLRKGLKRYSKKSLARHNGVYKFYAKDKKSTVKPGPKTAPAPRICKLRQSFVPGTVCIVLAGRFAGKRVIFLKQLEKSGLLLVTGPFRFNGVPLRRIAQNYLLPTSTKVELENVDLSGVTDETFKKDKTFYSRRFNAKLFGVNKVARLGKSKFHKEHKLPAAARTELQKKVDEPIIASVKKVELLADYLSAHFSLRNGQYPHLMKF